MILLDTNVISEPLKASPNEGVVRWLDAQQMETLFLPVVVVAELRFGAASLPSGKRRRILQERIDSSILPLFANRVLPLDASTTVSYVHGMVKARQAGVAVSIADGYIAAIASANNMTIATRDVEPFLSMGLNVINPWDN